MGVTGLWQLIDSSGKPVPVEVLENKILAIDISIWLHQVVKGFQDSKGNTLANAHLLGLFNRLCKLLFFKIKPIFVFDGGAPALKKQTMAKRFESKNKYRTEADRIQQLLMESLAKEKIVQQALGTSTKLLISPSKKNPVNKETEKEDMFKLPPIKENGSIISIDSSTDLLSDSESSFDEPTSRNYYHSLNTIDVNSSNFKSLPPDVRLEILTDMKELRKQSSWGRLHELPAQSNDFSSFQMIRLLKRRQVQLSLEEAEKEVGGKCLSMGELETLLVEVGVEIDSNVGKTRNVISDENTRFLLVRDLKKAMEKQAIEKNELDSSTEIPDIVKYPIPGCSKSNSIQIQDIIKEPIPSCSKDQNKIYEEKINTNPIPGCSKQQLCEVPVDINELDDDNDEDLQRAIKMSLQNTSDSSDCEMIDDNTDNCEIIKMSDEQKKLLSGAASSLARGFMMEYAGFSNEDVADLLNLQETSKTNKDETFQYNDSFIVKGESTDTDIKPLIVPIEISKLPAEEPITSTTLLDNSTKETLKISTDVKETNENILESDSDTDSDFIDVPNNNNDSNNLNIDHQNDFNTSDMEIFPVHPMTADLQDTKDLTRDFRLEHLELIIKPIQTKDELQDDIFADIFQTNNNLNEIDKKIEGEQENNISNILEELNKEKANISKLDLNSLELPESKDKIILEDRNIMIEEEILEYTNKIENKIMKDEKKKHEIIVISESSPNLNQSQATVDSQATIIDESFHNIEKLSNEEDKINDESNSVIEIIPVNEVIEINDDDSSIADIGNRSAIPLKTPKKQTNINSYFQEDSQRKIQKTPDTNLIDENIPKITKPFFINKSPKSKKKDVTTEKCGTIDGERIKVKKTLFNNSNENNENSEKETAEKIIEKAANILKVTKTNDELKDLATQLNHNNKELEIERNKQNRLGTNITERMSKDCMDLLKLFGIPYIVAPMEAEAQCAFLNEINMTDGTITDDSDIWLFGGKTVYKNFFNQKKYVTEFTIDNVEQLFNINRKKLIQLAMLVGSDYTTGISGVGAVTAMEILASFPATPEKEGETNELMSMLSGLRKFRDWLLNGKAVGPGGKTALRSKLKNVTLSDGFPHISIVEAYLHPTVDQSREKFTWGNIDPDILRDYAKKTFGWTEIRTNEILMPIIKRQTEKKSQQSITNYFKLQRTTITNEIKVSKRVQKAINKMSGTFNSDDEDVVVKKLRKTRKKNVTQNKVNNQSDDDVQLIENLGKESTGTSSNKNKLTSKPTGRKKTNGRKRKIDNLTEETSNSTKISINNSTTSQLISRINLESIASTSRGTSSTSKIVRIPNGKQIIPQREKDVEEMESNKLKAIELFKKSKTK